MSRAAQSALLVLLVACASEERSRGDARLPASTLSATKTSSAGADAGTPPGAAEATPARMPFELLPVEITLMRTSKRPAWITLDAGGVVRTYERVVAHFTPSGIVAPSGAMLIEFRGDGAVVLHQTATSDESVSDAGTHPPLLARFTEEGALVFDDKRVMSVDQGVVTLQRPGTTTPRLTHWAFAHPGGPKDPDPAGRRAALLTALLFWPPYNEPY